MIMSSDIPPLTTTGIGSLPHLEVEAALDLAFQVDLPYFPTLPQLGSGEGILAEAWGRAWAGFFGRLEKLKPPWIKLQSVGPATLSLARRDLTEKKLAEQIQGLLKRAEEKVDAVRRRGSRVLFFIDEPSLFQINLRVRGPGTVWEALRGMVEGLRSAGATVGIHCCGAADFSVLWELGLRVISFDADLSLEGILRGGEKFRIWLAGGGRLALGAVPTLLPSSWNLKQEVQRYRTQFLSTLGEEFGKKILRESLLTPACGLGLRSVSEAEAVFLALKEFQQLLKRNID